MNKISKGKAVGLLSLGLASVALGSVGFASWVISTTNVGGSTNVSVTVADVTDTRLTIGVVAVDANVTLDCGGKTAGNLGFTVGDGSAAEDLEFSVKVTIEAGDDYASGEKNLKFDVAFPGTITADNLLEVKEVKEGGSSVTYSNFTVTPTAGSTIEKTYTFNLRWGSAFKYKNPVELTTDDNVTIDAAKTGLEKLQSALSGVDDAHKIKVTLSEAAA